MPTQHTSLLTLPQRLQALGLNVVALEGWEYAQGEYFWTDPLTEKKSYDNDPSGYMVHHTGKGSGKPSSEGGAIATPVVRTSGGTWSKANAWLGFYDAERNKLYQYPQPGKNLPATIVLTSAGPARISSGYGFWPMAEDYTFQDLRPPYWDQPNSDTNRALNRYVFNLEVVHSGDGGSLDTDLFDHIVGLGIALHQMYGWGDRTIGHPTWTNRKIDPYMNGRRDFIVVIQDAIQAGLEDTNPPIDPEPPIEPPEVPLNNTGRNMQYVREGDTGQEVEYWQVMVIQASTGVLLEDSDWPTSNRAYIENMAPVLEWKVWDAAMTAYTSAFTGRNSYGIGATERVMVEAEVARLRAGFS